MDETQPNWSVEPTPARRVARLGAPLAVAGPLSSMPDAALIAPLGMRSPKFLFDLQRGTGLVRAQTWLEVGEALIQVGRYDRSKVAWERGLVAIETAPEARPLAATFYWRLGQLGEGTQELTDAAYWYERAADAFRREGASADEATARMALGRVAFNASGGGEARQHVRDAVAAAREAGPEGAALLGEALEMAGEVAIDLGHHDEAIAALRDAIRQHQLARRANGGGQPATEEVRAGVVLAEALLDAGQVVAAVAAYEAIEPFIEAHESLETRGRGLALLALLNLELGRFEEATEPVKKALECLDLAGAVLRQARLHLGIAQRIERRAGPADARLHYERAWALAKGSRDRLRLAPIGYALSRLYAALGEWVLADLAIEEVLPIVQSAGDLEGLVRCTELAVKIATKLAQGQLALDRLMLLARTRGRLGDRFGELRGLRVALAATIAVPGLDPGRVTGEFMETLRQTGTAALGPGEAIETAESLAKKHLPRFSAEIALMEAERFVADGRIQDGARMFARSAAWSIAAKDRWAAVENWDRAIDLGESVGMAEVKQWTVERTIAAE